MTSPLDDRIAPRLGHELSPTNLAITDETVLHDALLTGDHPDVTASFVELVGCRLDHVRMLAGHLGRSRLVDCVVSGSDLSGLVLDDCVLSRVEFRDCRLSAVQASGGRFQDVAFLGCKLDGANFRMSNWTRAHFEGCELAEADFYAANMPESRFTSCDLSAAQFSKGTLTGSRLTGVKLDGLKGGDALRGVVIATDLVVPVALAVFGTMGIVVDDDDG